MKRAAKKSDKKVAPKTRVKTRKPVKRPAKPETIDEYLAQVNPEQRAALQHLRKTIRAVAPGAEECISYGIAAFRLNGMLVGLGATAKHCAFYLMSTDVAKEFADELAAYDMGKGTIRFAASKPLPTSLVRRLVKARIAENAARSAR
jgi:uncharacterized protein YdhG (YjbR/CyaY superfamily)